MIDDRQRRYQVFVGSTFRDLQNERRKLGEVMLEIQVNGKNPSCPEPAEFSNIVICAPDNEQMRLPSENRAHKEYADGLNPLSLD